MELTPTHIHRSKAPLAKLSTSIQQSLLTYIDKHAGVFEALTRQGAPFGGNWLPVSNPSAGPDPVYGVREQLVSVQRQVHELTQAVASLNHQIEAIQPSSEATRKESASADPTSAIGINRFRDLQAGS